MSKKVLWFASKSISDDELNGLTSVIKEPIVLTEMIRDVRSAHAIKETIRSNDIIIVSKPPQYMKDVLKLADDRIVLRPCSEPTGYSKPPFRKFTGYKKLKNVIVEIDEEDFV